MENQISLQNKIILVTGGSRGIGAGICRAAAACGASLAINYHKQKEAADALAATLRRQYGIKVMTHGANIAQHEEVLQMFETVDKELGPVDVLVNNAGCENAGHAVTLRLQDWDTVFNVNLRGAFACAQEAAKRMMQKNKGVIINISSIHDKVPRTGYVHYCSAKAAMNMMTKCLSLEWAENNIRVVTVAPGAIETEMNRREIEHFGRDKFNNWIPAGRVGTVEDVAWTCMFLASDRADYITATEIYIDGGYKESTIPYDSRPEKQ